MQAQLRSVVTIGVAGATLALAGSIAHAAFAEIDFPAIGAAGLGEFKVVGGTMDDTLLWRSATVNTDKEFRVWSLESDNFYGLSYGKTDADPGRIIGLCGFVAGFNTFMLDLAAGKAKWLNYEPFGERRITHEGTEYKVKYNPVQGEFADKFETFEFLFDATADKVDSKHTATAHSAEWVAASVAFGPAVGMGALRGALESTPHLWNATSTGLYEITALGGLRGDIIPDEVHQMAMMQLSVPAPGGSLALLAAAGVMVARRRR